MSPGSLSLWYTSTFCVQHRRNEAFRNSLSHLYLVKQWFRRGASACSALIRGLRVLGFPRASRPIPRRSNSPSSMAGSFRARADRASSLPDHDRKNDNPVIGGMGNPQNGRYAGSTLQAVGYSAFRLALPSGAMVRTRTAFRWEMRQPPALLADPLSV
jgi:hypothetical protein